MIKRSISVAIDSTFAISAFAGLIGVLIYYLALYACGVSVIAIAGVIYFISGAEFMDAVTDIHSIVQVAHSGGIEWSPISSYGAYLLLSGMFASFCGGRVAGRLAPQKEYWASTAMIAIIYSIAYFSDISEFALQAWFTYLILLASILAAFLGARRARHINIVAP